jgi:uncharacterized damage-inducible protein DinB
MTPAHAGLMARYNQWMNARLYALCATLGNDQLLEDRGAFFQSIYLTLNHIMYADLAFLSRFTGDPAQVPMPGAPLFDGFARLHRERQALDQRILAWTGSLTAEWLAAEMTYVGRFDGKRRTMPRWVSLTHMFNHQTHHRGQVTTLLSQMGLDMGSTDIAAMSEFEPGVPG